MVQFDVICFFYYEYVREFYYDGGRNQMFIEIWFVQLCFCVVGLFCGDINGYGWFGNDMFVYLVVSFVVDNGVVLFKCCVWIFFLGFEINIWDFIDVYNGSGCVSFFCFNCEIVMGRVI